MKFTLGIALSPLDQLTGLAGTAEECGFASIALPDSLFYAESVSAAYPYTVDGSRFWSADTPWSDPMVAAAAMGAVTTRIRFYTQVLKLNPRNPVLLARQVGSVATLTGTGWGLASASAGRRRSPGGAAGISTIAAGGPTRRSRSCGSSSAAEWSRTTASSTRSAGSG